MPTINYYLDHPNKDEPRPLMVRIFWRRGLKIERSTGRKFHPKNWDGSKVKGTGASTTNLFLTGKLGELAKVIDDNPGQPLDFYKKQIDVIYKGEVQEVQLKKRVTGICDIIEAFQERKKATRSPGYVRAFTPTKDHIKESVGNIPLELFGLKEFEKLTDYLIKNGSLNNTIHSNIKRTKTVIMDAAKRGMKVNPSYMDYIFREDSIQTYRLDWDEVEAFAGVACTGTRKHVKDLSLIRAYTGIRFSDMQFISRKTIIERGGKNFFSFTMFKTHKVSEILVPEPAMNIIRSYNYNLPQVSQQKHNIHIKKICEKAKINTQIEKVRYSGGKRIVTTHFKYDLITTHSFRRAFARKLYDDGIAVGTISKLLGHSEVSTTMKYIGIDHYEGHEAVDKVFNFKQMRVAK